jgi:TRIAD3 protein (E3 ubiquitin-protein ligase RNF216)
LHDNVEDRHEQEVKKAADEAMAKVRAENPDLSDADLMIQVSDRVKKAEQSRKVTAVAEAHEFPYHMVDGFVQRRPRQAAANPRVAFHAMHHLPPAIALPAGNLPAAAAPPVAQYVPMQPQAVLGVPMPAPQYPFGFGVPPLMLQQVPQYVVAWHQC